MIAARKPDICGVRSQNIFLDFNMIGVDVYVYDVDVIFFFIRQGFEFQQYCSIQTQRVRESTLSQNICKIRSGHDETDNFCIFMKKMSLYLSAYSK